MRVSGLATSEWADTVRHVRLIVTRCEVSYSGRLNAFLPESTRLLMLEDDGAVLLADRLGRVT